MAGVSFTFFLSLVCVVAGFMEQDLQQSLHTQMKSMMDEDIDGDDVSAGAFLQKEGSDDYVRDSASSLSMALGPRWNGAKLEKDATEKTAAFLNGIAGKNSLGAINTMMNALR